MRCEQELCPCWTGSGCVCEVLDIDCGKEIIQDDLDQQWSPDPSDEDLLVGVMDSPKLAEYVANAVNQRRQLTRGSRP